MHNHNVPTSLLLQLLPQASLLIASSESGRDVIDDQIIKDTSLKLGYPDNLSFPDILYDVRSRLFVGLTFHSTDWGSASAVFAGADGRVVEFKSESVQDGLPTPRLDIQWALSEALAFEGAQIADVLFYFQDDPVVKTTKLAAIELRYIDEILASHKLTFPSEFAFDSDEVNWI